MANLTQNYVKNYLNDTYGGSKHDIKKLTFAAQKTSKYYKFNSVDLFHFIIENEDFGAGLNSYGFNTAYGREVKNYFSNIYYSL